MHKALKRDWPVRASMINQWKAYKLVYYTQLCLTHYKAMKSISINHLAITEKKIVSCISICEVLVPCFQSYRTRYITFQAKNSGSAINSVLPKHTFVFLCASLHVGDNLWYACHGVSKRHDKTMMQPFQLLRLAKKHILGQTNIEQLRKY